MNHDYAKPTYESIPGSEVLTEAHELINGPRQKSYSHPFDDYSKVRNIFQAMTGINLTVEQSILFMVAVKLARLNTNIERGKWHRDSLVDAAGYLGCLSMARHHRTHNMPEPFRDEQ